VLVCGNASWVQFWGILYQLDLITGASVTSGTYTVAKNEADEPHCSNYKMQ